MKGCITKKHFFQVAWVIGLRTAIRLLLSKKPVALMVLVEGIQRA